MSPAWPSYLRQQNSKVKNVVGSPCFGQAGFAACQGATEADAERSVMCLWEGKENAHVDMWVPSTPSQRRAVLS